ncbi:MAG TPA: hypothetical protein ENG44_01725, partial [Desulfurococcaceae archaeon]|nr:hypothetical protein [Desulfurococcaceae archaeon]
MSSKSMLILIVITLLIASALIVEAQSTSERYRPLIGGIRIVTGRLASGSWDEAGESTIGYGAIDINSGEKGIVIAAHAIYNTTSGIFYPLVYQPSCDDIPQNSNNFINVYDRYF